MSDTKINVLVIPDLFPKFKGDVQGIFILDYLSATHPYCHNTVLFGRLTAEQKGVTVEKNDTHTLYRFSVAGKKVPFYLKPWYYLLWFIKGYQTGKVMKNIDIIHAHGSILSGTLSYILSKKLHVPFIITEHQGPFSMTSENFWKRIWTKFIMQKANAVLTVSHHLKQEILDTKIHPKQIIVTHNPVDTELFQLKHHTIHKTIVFVGRLDNFKGALRCVEAFNMIHKAFPDWTFTIVGDGEDFQPITHYLNNKPQLKSKIRLTGQLSKAGIAHEMQQSDFLVFPSKHESFGLVIAEALSSGLPVIVGNTTAPQEFVNSKNGLLVHYSSIPEIAKAMEHMINKASEYDPEMIRSQIVSDFGFESFGKKTVNIYNSLINKC
ncbi:MAG: glycosyltransferase [Bacteroidetes bacterium]|nr:glycosyltransferase [Bacteroidota bacterium]